MSELHTDPLSLPRSGLPPRFQRAIEAVVAAQKSGPAAAWENHPDHRVLALEDGTHFIPDMEDANTGNAALIFGGIAMLFGLALAVVFFDGKQAEPWMPIVAPPLIAVGGYLVAKGRRRNQLARAAPRTTGAYLFDDALVHVGLMGCRIFPVARVRGFTRRSRGGSQKLKIYVQYAEDSGQEAESHLFYPDATVTLNAWLERNAA